MSLVAGGSIATFLFQSSNQGSVQVIGSGLGLFTDPQCTLQLASGQPLPAFGAINLDATTPQSGTSTVYLKNLGTTNLDPQISVTGLRAGMQLDEATIGQVTGTLKSLMAGQVFQPSGTIPSMPTGGIPAGALPSLTPGGAIPGSAPASGYFMVESELFHYASISANTFNGLTRGLNGTANVAHPASTIIFGDMVAQLLAPNAVKTVSLVIVPDSSIKIGDTSTFTVTFQAGPGS